MLYQETGMLFGEGLAPGTGEFPEANELPVQLIVAPYDPLNADPYCHLSRRYGWVAQCVQAGPEILGGIRSGVGEGVAVSPRTATGRPYPAAAKRGATGRRCIRRCVGEGGAVPPQTPKGHSHPSVAQAGPERLGCIRRCVKVDVAVPPSTPTGRFLSLRVPGNNGDPRLLRRPRGVPIPLRPRQDWGDSGVSAAVWGSVVHYLLKLPRGVCIPQRPKQDRRDPGVCAAV